ncbi:MAG: nucleotide excision repair endonuclease [Candidatus Atribacteria bacterium]|nr:nucleotide excision repair endonuclease [Candidatus Atribacteria bacterium]
MKKKNYVRSEVSRNSFSELPASCGVYLLHNESHEIIYVGKAVNIQSRIRSHLRQDHASPLKRDMADEIAIIQFILTQDEHEALLLEEELIKGESDWKLRVNRQKGEFAERDANNFLKAYQEMTAAVKTYADRNGIALVIRFNGAPIDSTNPQAVQMELSKLVMHYHKDIDITDQILAELNRNAAVATPRTQPPPRR